jgi:hypothetical protein
VSLSQLLLDVALPDKRRDAWKQLYQELQRLVGAEFLVASTGKVLRIPKADQLDIVNAVAVKILEHGALKVAGKSEGESKRYLQAMLRNKWLDEQRKLVRRERHAQLEAEQEEAGPLQPAAEEALHLPYAEKLLDAAYQELHARRAPRFRQELERTWTQVRALAFGQATMEDLMRRDEGVTESTSPSERKAAQQRIHQNHSRLRKTLNLTVDVMEREAKVSPEDAAATRRLIGELNRCQRSSAGSVPPSDTP